MHFYFLLIASCLISGMFVFAVPVRQGATAGKKKACSQVSSPRSPRSLIKRSGGQLCNVNMRQNSVSGCRGNSAYLKRKGASTIGIVHTADPERLRHKVASGEHFWDNYDPWLQENYEEKECDHAVELQLSTKTLESAQFCQALERILKVLERRKLEVSEGKGLTGTKAAQFQTKLKANLAKSMQERLRATSTKSANDDDNLYRKLNDNRMNFFLHKPLNAAKMALTKNSVSTTATENVSDDNKVALRKYFKELVGPAGKSVAEAIDTAAAALIKKAAEDARAGIVQSNVSDWDDDDEIDCALESFKADQQVTKAYAKLLNEL